MWIRNVKVKTIIIITIIFSSHLAFAGSFVEVDGKTMYANDYGEFAKSTWVWIDTNNDSIAECYRFNADGSIAVNYEDSYGKKTNDKGQLIENNEVIKKMLSNGTIVSGKKTPASFVTELIGNIINPKKKLEKDRLTNRTIDNKYYDEIPETIIGIDGVIIDNTGSDTIDILMGETAEQGIVYAGGKDSEIIDNVKDNRNIVAGKDFRKFISSKNKCTEKVSETYVYGGERWNDVLLLSGNGARVKFNLDGNNYVRFEVAHQTHSSEVDDTNIKLELYADGELLTSFDEFVDGKPEIVEEYVPNIKNIELKVNIESGSKGMNVYIRNGRFKKVKEDNIP